ncbi:MAG: OmpA family protein, partial [Phycisphaeraceae bacterium]|nr:OmpA family protein [Phycisphaeraceae bacterium]
RRKNCTSGEIEMDIKKACALGLSLFALNGMGAAWAQYETENKVDRRFYLSPMATFNVYDDDRNFDDGLGYHFALGKILGRGANMEIHGTFAEADGKGSDGVDGELTSYGVSFMLFQARNTFPLYGVLSVARGVAEAPNNSDREAESDQFDAGIGYLLGLGKWPLIGEGAFLRLEARYRFDKYSQGQANIYEEMFGVTDKRSYHDGIFGIGLFIPLGADPNAEPEPEEPEPVTQIVVTAQDSDGDQIPDDMDQCPDTPQGAEIDVRGCERDADKDGVVNSKDKCQGTPAGVAVNADGCPADTDGDGVNDLKDQCPSTPEGSTVLADGCALQGDCRVPEAGQRIDERGCAVGAVILKGVNFDTDSASLTPRARETMRSVAQALKDIDQVQIEVGGHTDSVGNASYNQQLSQRRAETVRDFLIAKGVDPDILTARGYGESQPLVSNDSPAGRETNRRVELKIINE